MKRKQGTGIKSWELTDEMWEAAQQFIPQRKREEGKTYQRKPGGGRKPLPPQTSIKSNLLRIANRYSMEGLAQGIWSGKQRP
jgi:hypothetical protein